MLSEKKLIVDLHTHTTASDGALSPSILVSRAKKANLAAVAITDHDTVGGVSEALAAGKKNGVIVVPGVEITVDDEKNKIFDIHVLGLFIYHKDKALQKALKKCRQARHLQKKEIIENLNNLRYDITFGRLNKIAKGEVSRSHIARYLLENYPRDFKDLDDVFYRLLGNEKKAYADRKIKISIKDAINFIRGAGGASFLAHPFLYSKYNTNELIRVFLNEGGDGIETVYAYNRYGPYKNSTKSKIKEIISKAQEIAGRSNLPVTGGSDFHREEDGQKLGDVSVPYEYLENIKKFLSDE